MVDKDRPDSICVDPEGAEMNRSFPTISCESLPGSVSDLDIESTLNDEIGKVSAHRQSIQYLMLVHCEQCHLQWQ